MDRSLILTIILAVIVMGLVIAGLGIGLILTGKQRLRKGCGFTPKKQKGSGPNKDESSCPMCGINKQCEQSNDDNPDKDKSS